MSKSWIKWVLILCVGVAILGGIAVWAYTAYYQGRIYARVTVMGIDVGNLTPDEARSLLYEQLPGPSALGIILHSQGREWPVSWADIDQHYDIEAMAANAYNIGREDSGVAQLWHSLQLRVTGYDVAPQIVPANKDAIHNILQDLAPELFIPALDAQLLLNPNGPVAIQGKPGHQLDIAATLPDVQEALLHPGSVVTLTLAPVLPNLAEPEPAATTARDLFAESFVVIVDDPLTEDFYTEFPVAPEILASWLKPVHLVSVSGTPLVLRQNAGAITRWLESMAVQLGERRILDIPQTRAGIVAALREGEHQVRATIRHPGSTYIVQPGDAFYDIAYNHYMPQWQLEKANPDVDPGAIDVGMALVIPSVDVLFPEPLVPGKRIEIDLPEQQLQAYEGDVQVFTMTVSSGISSTPTIAGQFQILFKEPDAYARRWDLEMPYFMGIYEEGDGYYNGIHELPIMAWGTRLSAGVLGWPASFGCIILDVGDAEALFNWAPVGTLVRIHGVAPGTPSWTDTLADMVPVTAGTGGGGE